MKYNWVIEYSELFNDYNEIDIYNLLEEVPPKGIINIICYLDKLLFIHGNSLDMQIGYLKELIFSFPDPLKKLIEEKLSNQIGKVNNIIIWNNLTNLELANYALVNTNKVEEYELTKENKIKFFKAYLYYNEKHTSKQIINIPENTVPSLKEYLSVYIQTQLAQQTINVSSIIAIEIYKSYSLFEFLESNVENSELLNKFLNLHNVSNSHQYLTNILKFILIPYKDENDIQVKIKINDFTMLNRIIKPFLINEINIGENSDFRKIREYPIYKIDASNYTVLNINFLIDKIFNGIQFTLSKIASENKINILNIKINTFPDFKSIYSEIFSEKYLFIKIMQKCFCTKKSLFYLESELKEKIADNIGHPDLLIRSGKNIFLFEFKDSIIPSTVIHSYNFKIIQKEIVDKFAKLTKTKAKGIGQLVNCIASIEDGKYNSINIHSEKINIYPILVFTDKTLKINGFNYLLNQLFKEKSLQFKKIKKVNELTMIHLDTFIILQDYFNKNKIKFKTLIDKYLKKRRLKRTNEDISKEFSRVSERIDEVLINSVNFKNKTNPQFIEDIRIKLYQN